MSEKYKNNIELLRNAGNRKLILETLDSVKDYLADARNGDWNVETRKAAIVAIDKVLYNKIKTTSADSEESEEWI